MGPGVDPHLYKASESDVRRLSEADLILYNGLYLEGKMGDILVKLARSRPVVAVIETDSRGAAPRAAGVPRPLRPAHLVRRQPVGPDARPDHRRAGGAAAAARGAFRANADALRAELDELDAWVTERIWRSPRSTA